MHSAYIRAIPGDFSRLPIALQKLHRVEKEIVINGCCRISTGKHWSSILLQRLLSLPEAAEHTPCQVTISPEYPGEIWQRKMGNSLFTSKQWEKNKLIFERVGGIVFGFKMKATTTRLTYELAQFNVFSIPVPRLFWPHIVAVESIQEGSIHFEVSTNGLCSHLLVKYEGLLHEIRQGETLIWENKAYPK